jgi:hypothetical protein
LYKQWDSFQELAQEGLIAKLLHFLVIDRLGSKGITKLFPIQVTRSGGSSPFFGLKPAELTSVHRLPNVVEVTY